MNIRITMIVIGLTVTAATAAHAENIAKASADAAFTKMDANSNGNIDRSEFDAYAKAYADKQKADFDQQYAELDANNDGKIDKAEAGANAALEAYFDQIDEDSNGLITKQEIASAITAANQASGSH